jgi:two-component system heavy metal sensor histidine kinase CusS
MTNFRSLRVRLTIWYAAVVLAALLAFAGWMWWAVHRHLAINADVRIASRLQGLHSAIDTEADESTNALREELHEFAIEVPEGELTAVRGRGGRDLLRATGLPEAVLWSAPQRVIGDLQVGNTRYRAVRTQINVKGETYEFAVATSTAEADMFLAQFRLLLLGAAPMLALIAAAGGYWMSRRALSPVDRLTQAARRISLDNLEQRLQVEPTGDELERLGVTWNEMLARLDDAVQRMRRFTADASHELRTPIAVIRTSAELALRREREGQEYRQTLVNIQREAEWMTQLAEDLLLLARADSGTLQLCSAPVAIDRLTRGVTNETAPMAEVRGIALSTRLEAQDTVISGDERALHRLLTILLDNAIQYTPAQGKIEVATSLTKQAVLVAVSNSGPGIGREDMPHIFERFYRGDPARTRQNGAGLGLAIAQSIVQAHNAAIDVESEPGEGAVFRLRLPRS